MQDPNLESYDSKLNQNLEDYLMYFLCKYDIGKKYKKCNKKYNFSTNDIDLVTANTGPFKVSSSQI
jgi:Mor family transcriptional regulator